MNTPLSNEPSVHALPPILQTRASKLLPHDYIVLREGGKRYLVTSVCWVSGNDVKVRYTCGRRYGAKVVHANTLFSHE